jgi:hypothetical protein
MLTSIKADEISSYFNANPDAKIGNWPLEIGGVKKILPYYRVPIKYLVFNVDNGRLAMEVREWQKNNNRALDANQPEDAKVICELLLNLDKTQTDLLLDDLESKGQMEPGVITNDGIVINGNRRMALLEQLQKKTPTGKWDYLEAVRLEPNVSQQDLWKIEAGLQLSKDKKAEYHPVNELLKIKQGIQAGLNSKQIAAAMYGKTEIEINEDIERLELIEDFLSFMKQEMNYGLIKKFGYHEYFIDIQKNLLNAWKRKGVRSQDRQKKLLFVFALLRANIKLLGNDSRKKKKGLTHWDIRELGKIFDDPSAEATFEEHLKKSTTKQSDLLSVDPEIIFEDFRGAKEVIENREDRDKPIILIDKAIKALQSIDTKSIHNRGDSIKAKLNQLREIINQMDREIDT